MNALPPERAASSSPGRPRVSGLAILALATSLVFCLPIGAVLGGIALFRIQAARGALSGRGYAFAAVGLSLVLNGGTYFFMSRVYPVLLENGECYAQQLMVGRELTRIQRLEALFLREHKRYGTLDEIGFTPASPADPYRYEVVEAKEDTYRVVATARKAELNGDTWSLDQTGIPRNLVFGCSP